MRWTPALSIDDGLLDEQHRQLFIACNRLHAACASGDTTTITAALAALRTLAEAHAGEEERRLASAGSRWLAHQQRQHRRFLAELEALQQHLHREGPALLHAACHPLAVWIIDHIIVDDHACAEDLREAALMAGGAHASHSVRR